MTQIQIKQCQTCIHYEGMNLCRAFPKGIPSDILNGTHDHFHPYPGDDGVQRRVEKHIDPHGWKKDMEKAFGLMYPKDGGD